MNPKASRVRIIASPKLSEPTEETREAVEEACCSSQGTEEVDSVEEQVMVLSPDCEYPSEVEARTKPEDRQVMVCILIIIAVRTRTAGNEHYARRSLGTIMRKEHLAGLNAPAHEVRGFPVSHFGKPAEPARRDIEEIFYHRSCL